MEYDILDMSLDRHEELLALWGQAEGVMVSEDDRYENLQRFLDRNPGSNYMVLDKGRVIAAVKCSHDGRKGYIHHLAVDPAYQGRGIARALVAKCLEFLKSRQIRQVRLFVMDTNTEALRFWRYLGFDEKEYVYRTYQMELD